MEIDTKKQKKRLAWVDIAKAMAIILVIVGHEMQGILKLIIYSFHMPLFFILTGYTMSPVDSLPKFKTTVMKSFQRMYVPAIFAIIFFVIENAVFNKKVLVNFWAYLWKTIFHGSAFISNVNDIGVLVWFLIALFWGKVLFMAIGLLFRGTDIGPVIFLIFIRRTTVKPRIH